MVCKDLRILKEWPKCLLSKELRLKEERSEMSRREWRIDRSRERW